MAPLKFRGAFGTSYSLVLNIGLLITYLIGLKKDTLTVGRLDTSAFVVIFPMIGSIIQLVTLPFFYDSPSSLNLRDQRRESIMSADFYGLILTDSSQNLTVKSKKQGLLMQLRNKAFLKPLFIGCMMGIIQVCTMWNVGSATSNLIISNWGPCNPYREKSLSSTTYYLFSKLQEWLEFCFILQQCLN